MPTFIAPAGDYKPNLSITKIATTEKQRSVPFKNRQQQQQQLVRQQQQNHRCEPQNPGRRSTTATLRRQQLARTGKAFLFSREKPYHFVACLYRLKYTMSRDRQPPTQGNNNNKNLNDIQKKSSSIIIIKTPVLPPLPPHDHQPHGIKRNNHENNTSTVARRHPTPEGNFTGPTGRPKHSSYRAGRPPSTTPRANTKRRGAACTRTSDGVSVYITQHVRSFTRSECRVNRKSIDEQPSA